MSCILPDDYLVVVYYQLLVSFFEEGEEVDLMHHVLTLQKLL